MKNLLSFLLLVQDQIIRWFLLSLWVLFFFFPLRHFICMYYIPRKRIQGFSLLYVFVLLLHGPWCQLRLSVQWNQTDGMGAGYSAIFLDLWVVHQIWGWSLHTFFTLYSFSILFFSYQNICHMIFFIWAIDNIIIRTDILMYFSLPNTVLITWPTLYLISSANLKSWCYCSHVVMNKQEVCLFSQII